ncbi:hypothetical protein AVEN_130295-1 [Araneus ventricosus]|uniref:Uncharacterized protein n=1 Tax=Araneus ventricosus TaxID=182803 RepID=A0A4Y2GII5_ARAVE|nr:hypothetical protein AVEN_130295-1 [Araneus ventricosus]
MKGEGLWFTNLTLQGGRGGLEVRFQLRGRWVPGSKPDSTEVSPVYVDLLYAKSCTVDQMPSCWCGAEAWRGVPAQMSSDQWRIQDSGLGGLRS